MKTLLVSFAALVCICVAVRAETETTQDKAATPSWAFKLGKDEKELPSVRLPIGGIGYLHVTISRQKFDDSVTLEVQGLPDGVTVREGPQVLKVTEAGQKETSTTFTLVAAKDLKAGKLEGAKVVAKSNDTTKEVSFPIGVTDFSLQTGSGAVMAISIITVLILVSYCIYRVFTLPPVDVEEHLKGPLEIDTRDTKDAD